MNAKSEDEAIAAIEALGGEFIVIESEPRTLDLGDAQITDAGIEHLKGFTSLSTLYLNNTQVTDAGLAHLKGLTSLRQIDLAGTKVTHAGIEELRAALPGCRVHGN